jgi:hypothetical protein
VRIIAVLGAIALVAGGGLARAQGAVAPPDQYPDATVVAALARLEEPSHPGPLAGDPLAGLDEWSHPGACTDVAGAYQAAGAPVPTGATVTPGRRGSFTVAGPFGTSGIFVEEHGDQGHCDYGIATAPTVEVTAPGVTTAAFEPVGCASIFGIPLVLTEIDNAGVTMSIVASQTDPAQPWTVALVSGVVLEDAIHLSDIPPGAIQADGQATYDGTALAFDGTGAAGAVSLRLHCTPFTTLASPGG